MTSVEALTRNALELTADQRLKLLVDLWESLAPEPEPLSDAERQMLDESLAAYRERPHDTIPLEEVEKLLREHRR